MLPQSASRGTRISGLPDSLPLRPARLFASLGGSDRVASANRDFYFQASDELVTLPIAGYDYGSNWTISADGTFTHKNNSVIRCTRTVRARLRIRLPPWMGGGEARIRDKDAERVVGESSGQRSVSIDPKAAFPSDCDD